MCWHAASHLGLFEVVVLVVVVVPVDAVPVLPVLEPVVTLVVVPVGTVKVVVPVSVPPLPPLAVSVTLLPQPMTVATAAVTMARPRNPCSTRIPLLLLAATRVQPAPPSPSWIVRRRRAARQAFSVRKD
jgi:hypothetical protein